MTKEKTKGSKICEAQVGKQLVDSLANDQIAALLDVMFSEVETPRLLEGLREADSDMGETVARLLGMEDPGAEGRSQPASDKKLLEIWETLWERWDDIVFEVGDEEGRYAFQEVHWEAPYFDGYTLAKDLDEIAAEMFDLIDDLFGLVKSPDLFREAIDEIDSAILGYPEWMAPGDPCCLEKDTTRCVLKWLWLASRKREAPAEALLDGVLSIEDTFLNVALDDDEIVAFFTDLPEQVCREIYEHLHTGDYEAKVNDVPTRWHALNHIYEERFDPAKYLQTSRAHLHENWTYGKPLVRDAVEKGDYRAAENLLEQTFMSYLRLKEKEVWRPETSLLQTKLGRYYPRADEGVSELLDLWASVSENLGDAARSAASRLQSTIWQTPENWDAVISKLRELRAPDFQDVIDRLFAEWQNMMACRSIRSISDKGGMSDTWIHWLIDAEVERARRSKTFTKKLENWLDALKKDGGLFDDQWPLLARLTKDLPESDNLRREYPTFCQVVLPDDASESQLRESRRQALEDMNVEAWLPVATAVWKTRLRRIVPDPAHSYKSSYTWHAEWMKALLELNPSEYNRLLAEWRETHRRRRNLWRDMAAHDLPV